MITYICQYRFEGKEVSIEAETPDEAYAKFLEQTGSKRDLVYISWGKSKNEVRSEHFDPNEHIKAFDKIQNPVEHIVNSVAEDAPNSEKMLSFILENQIKQTELLNKIRWSLFWIVFFVATIWAFGFVIQVK